MHAALRHLPCSARLERWSLRCSSAESAALVLSERNRARRSVSSDPSEASVLAREAPDDYYSLLRCHPGASFAEVKASYRQLSKLVHPDVAGPSATSLAVVMNIAVATLLDQDLRLQYDEALDAWRRESLHFSGLPVSAWGQTAEALAESEAIFVDECACIGCRKCVNVAPNSFAMEEEWGRARVHTQWGDSRALIAEAVDTCPVSTIYYVAKGELPLLEFTMKNCKREDVAVLARRRGGNFGASPGNDDPFAAAALFLASRRAAFAADEVSGRLRQRAQDTELAAAIASAWLQLDAETRALAWPEIGGRGGGGGA